MRKNYLDNIRWVTVVQVVIFHLIMVFSPLTPGFGFPFREVQYQDAFAYLVYPWFMTILFIVAGISSRIYLDKHTIKDFVICRTRKLLLPVTIGLACFGWMQGALTLQIAGYLEPITESTPIIPYYLYVTICGIGVLWFVILLWSLSMILAVIRRFEKGKLYALTANMHIAIIVLLGVVAWFIGQYFNVTKYPVYRLGLYPFVFFLGYFVFAHEENIKTISKWKYVFIAGAVVLGARYVYEHFGHLYSTMPVMGCKSAMFYGWIMILAIFGSFYSWLNKPNAFCDYMRKRSWGLYIFHYVIISACALVIRKHTAMTEIPCYLVTGGAAFAGSLLLNYIVSRIPFMRWCILGIKKEKVA